MAMREIRAPGCESQPVSGRQFRRPERTSDDHPARQAGDGAPGLCGLAAPGTGEPSFDELLLGAPLGPEDLPERDPAPLRDASP